jgi:hypothetical protein
MYKNEKKMRLIKTIPGMWRKRDKRESWRA